MQTLSLIIPALNEEGYLGPCLESTRSLGAETIVVDGGSHDRTREIARQHGATVVESGSGRGTQLRAGAAAAKGEWLFFLHADSIISPGLPEVLAAAIEGPRFRIGTFRLRLDGEHILYDLYSWLTRFDSIWTSFGDQGIVIRRSFYDAIGGFPAWPILEDVALLERARRYAMIRSLPAEIISSSRRFEHYGIVRQQIRNGSIILRYLLGVAPESLARSYRTHNTPLWHIS